MAAIALTAVDLGQPVREAQVAHAAAVEAAGAEADRVAGDQAVMIADRPPVLVPRLSARMVPGFCVGSAMPTPSSLGRAWREAAGEAAISPGPEGWSGHVRRGRACRPLLPSIPSTEHLERGLPLRC